MNTTTNTTTNTTSKPLLDIFGITDTTVKLPAPKKTEKLEPSQIKIVEGDNQYLKELGFTQEIVKYAKKKMKLKSKVGLYENFANPYSFVIPLNQNVIDYVDRSIKIKLESVKNNISPNPIGRAYYKLWEIMTEFDLIPLDKSIKSGNIAEGPGGFINALIDYRKKNGKDWKSNKIFGITLINMNVPHLLFESNKVKEFMKKYRNDLNIITISKGADGTGNINKLENILEFSKYFKQNSNSKNNLKNNSNKHGADIVTGDGGIDTEAIKHIQEQKSTQLFFNQVVTTLSIQKKGGNSVIKCYTIMTLPTVQCIYLMTHFYKEVYITKPVTSKITNSERYIVCKNFTPPKNKKKILEALYKITENWKDDMVCSIFEKLNNNSKNLNANLIPDSFFKVIKKYNETVQKYNFETLDKIFELAKINAREANNNKMLRQMVQNNRDVAVKWLKEYELL